MVYIYIFFEIVLVVLIYIQTPHNRKTIFFVCCAILFILTGLVDGHKLTRDYPEYLNFFLGKASMYGSLDDKFGYDLELLYAWFCKLLRIVGQYDFVYVIGYSLLLGIPFMMLVRKYSNNYPLSLFLLLTFMSTNTYLFYMMVHRQMVSSACIMIAYLIYENPKPIKFKKYITILLLVLSLLGHSSTFLVLPILLMIYYFRLSIKKNTMILICLGSMLIGVPFANNFSNILNSFVLVLRGIESIERSTHYFINDVYESGQALYLRLLPTVFTTCSFIYFSKAEELKSFPLQCMFYATVAYCLFSPVPLFNRFLTLLFFFSFIGAMPVAVKRTSLSKLCLLGILFLNFYMAYRAYTRPGFLLPYHFMF